MIAALNKRYFNRYHPYYGWKHPKRFLGMHATGERFTLNDFKYPMAYEIGVLLNPKMGEDSIRKLCRWPSISNDILVDVKRAELKHDDGEGADAQKLREFYVKALLKAMWARLEEMVGEWYALNPPPPKQAQQANKRRRLEHEPECFLISDEDEEEEQEEEDDYSHLRGAALAKALARDEIHDFKSFSSKKNDEKNPLRQLASYDYRTMNQWYVEPPILSKWPALARVALGFYGMVPGSGGLECDIGALSDLLSPKRSRLDPGIVEVQAMIRLNKGMQVVDSTKIHQLGGDWETKIPKRTWIYDVVSEDWLVAGNAEVWEEEDDLDADENGVSV